LKEKDFSRKPLDSLTSPDLAKPSIVLAFKDIKP
ncbi:unnamed protein product, partial [marine sediment metagenome]